MEAAIVLKGVTKAFGRTKAVENLDLTMPGGALYGFIGPNGAGKTTSIRMIMSILFRIRASCPYWDTNRRWRPRIASAICPRSAVCTARCMSGLFSLTWESSRESADSGLQKRIETALESVGLGGTARKRCEELSKGMMQKVQFLAATIHKPDLLILDEPFSGLDPVSSRLLRELVLAEHKRGAAILFSTHVMQHAEEICDNVIMIHQGRKVLDERINSIRRQYDPRRIQFDPLDAGADISPLRGLPDVERIDFSEGSYEILLREGADPANAMSRIVQTVTPARIEVSRPQLEDVFIKLVSGGEHSTESLEQLRAGLTDNTAKAAAV